MGKVKYTENLGDLAAPQFIYDPLDSIFVEASRKTALYSDTSSGTQIELKGKFEFSFTGVFEGGKVTDIFVRNSSQQLLFSVTDVSFNAKQLDALLLDTPNFSNFLAKIHGGNDTFIGTANRDAMVAYAGSDRMSGKAGADAMNGGDGNDRLTGGAGSDVFIFTGDFGRDVITDFDAKGGGDLQDHISADPGEVRDVVKSGHDTIIKFDDGNRITLLDVRPTQITPDDFGGLM